MRGGTSLNGVLPIRERTHTDFDFLHGGLALSGVSRFLLLVFTGVDVVVVAFLTKWYNWPKFQILQGKSNLTNNFVQNNSKALLPF